MRKRGQGEKGEIVKKVENVENVEMGKMGKQTYAYKVSNDSKKSLLVTVCINEEGTKWWCLLVVDVRTWRRG